MNKELIFQREGQEIRIIKDESGEPLFCLRDICDSLKMENPANIKNAILKEFEGAILNIHPFQTQGGIQHFTMITEPQLYFMLMRSDKPKARDFRQWVINEVLPSIRKEGSYSVGASNEMFSLKDELIKAKNEVIKTKEELIETQRALINELKTKKEPQIVKLIEHKEPSIEEAYGDMLYKESKDKQTRPKTLEQRRLKKIFDELIELICVITAASNGNLKQRQIWTALYKNFIRAYKPRGRIDINFLKSEERYLNFLIQNAKFYLEQINQKQLREPEDFQKLLSFS